MPCNVDQRPRPDAALVGARQDHVHESARQARRPELRALLIRAAPSFSATMVGVASRGPEAAGRGAH